MSQQNAAIGVDSNTIDGSLASKQQLKASEVDESLQIRPTWFRYVVLFLFCLNSGNKAFQWIQIASSTKKLTYYYDVPNYVINSTSIVFMVSFIVLSIPACFVIELIGLRRAVLIGSFGTALGATIKCFSCGLESDADLSSYAIYLLFLGQITVSLSEQFIFSIPNKLASTWFPDNQVSSAVAVCILGQQFGVALGFLFPQYFLSNCETREQIGQGLYRLFLWTMIVSVAAFLVDFVLFYEKPRYAPGKARLKQIMQEQTSNSKTASSKLNIKSELAQVLKQMVRLLQSRDFNLLNMSFGINVGIGYTILTLLNQMLEPLWPNNDILIGQTGFLIIIASVFGSLLWGQLLDRSHKYLSMNIFLTLATIVSLIILTYFMCFAKSELGIYLSATLFGLFQTGFIVSGLELAVELTYPTPELISSSLLNISPQAFSILTIFLGSFIVDNYGTLVTNIFYLICTLVALILLLNIKEILKRQAAAETMPPEIIVQHQNNQSVL